MEAYKVLRIRKDGTLGSCFINRTARLPMGVVLPAEDYPTTGFAHRPGWHTCSTMSAPIMTHNAKAKLENRHWFLVDISGVTLNPRPPSQGGLCYRSQFMTIVDGPIAPAFD